MKSLKYNLILFLFLGAIPFINAQDDSMVDEGLKGKWTVSAVDAYAAPGTIPEYQRGDHVWDFGEGKNYSMTVTQEDGIENDLYTLPAGKHQFWSRKCLVKINNTIYRYRIDRPAKTPDNLKPGVFLYLNPKIDPKLSHGAYILILAKM